MMRIFMSAIIAGVLAGLFMTLVQQAFLTDYIWEAETYEVGAAAGHDLAGHTDGGVAAGNDGSSGAGLGRGVFSLVANVLVAVGLGLLLCASYALRGPVDWRRGLVWGVAGFAAFNLAPAIGLPPELPGAGAAALLDRQVWWVLTVIATAAGLGMIAFAKRIPIRALGIVLIVVPHLVGAPQPDNPIGLAPADLERSFVIASLAANAVFWLVLGGLTGFLFDRFGEKTAPQPT